MPEHQSDVPRSVGLSPLVFDGWRTSETGFGGG
jgi:hypothetical protein